MKRLSSVLLLAAALACGHGDDHSHDGDHAPAEAESWAVTAWGQRYEVFAETEALVAGRDATSNAHVTILDGFAPLEKGAVTAVLRGPGGREERFRQETPKRSGIFAVVIKPSSEGTFDLAFAIESGADREEIPAGRVQVGNAAEPGRGLGDEPGGDGLSFLKEQQWRTEFATEAAAEGALPETVSGPARVLPARGGAVVLTASVDAVVAAEPWPHVGQSMAAGAPVLQLMPRLASRSLPDLNAEATALDAEADAARRRLARLEDLLAVEATSAAEVERARAALAGLDARLEATRRGVSVAAGGPGQPLAVTAPWAGQVAAVDVTPGQAVAAGAALGRLVRPRPLWLEVALRPEDARRLAERPRALALRRGESIVEVGGADVRRVATAPELDARTGTLAVTLELDRSASELPIGSAVEAEVALAGERRGIVLPHTALVDDAGVAVVYVQDSGESFSRREVKLLARQGSRVAVAGLKAAERVVTRGGAAVRRASLLSSGAPEGHVH